MTDQVDCVVVGAGVIGLAIARALARSGREVILLERGDTIGSETSSRNSEVIHAGIYYPAGSWKARLCVAGRERLYDYCQSRGIGHRRIGKLIVAAAASQVGDLAALQAKAAVNGVTDLQWLEAPQARRLEPAVRCVAALLSPSTGIIDSHALMLSLQGEAEDAGAAIAFHSPVVGGWIEDAGFTLDIAGPTPSRFGCRWLVNAAGLGANALAQRLVGFDWAFVPPLHLAKGNYFMLSGKSPFNRLIYPLPDAASLDVHVTLDLAGRARFGPDVQWIDSIDYDIDARRAQLFYAAIRRYYPDLRDGALAPGYTGIRPKLQPPGGPPEDFVIQGPQTHGIPGLVNLFGIESPGLTSCLAIADEVVRRLA
jgi:L-2-hydroxyglutarate oxidase LhgO